MGIAYSSPTSNFSNGTLATATSVANRETPATHDEISQILITPATTVNGTIAIPLAPAVIQHAIPLITNPHQARLDHEQLSYQSPQQQPSAKMQDNAPRPSSTNHTTSEWSPQRYPQSWIAKIPHRPSSLQTTTPLYPAQTSCVPTQLTPYSSWNSKSATERRSKTRKPSTPPTVNNSSLPSRKKYTASSRRS